MPPLPTAQGGTGHAAPNAGYIMLTNGRNPFLLTKFPFIDFVNKMFGIGTETPIAIMHLQRGTITLPTYLPQDVFVIAGDSSNHVVLNMTSDRAKRAGLVVSDQDSRIQGSLYYDNADETWHFATDNVDRAILDATALLLKNTGGLLLEEQASDMATPAAGYLAVYAKTDDKVYKRTSAGTVTEIGAGGGGTESAANNVTRYYAFY